MKWIKIDKSKMIYEKTKTGEILKGGMAWLFTFWGMIALNWVVRYVMRRRDHVLILHSNICMQWNPNHLSKNKKKKKKKLIRNWRKTVFDFAKFALICPFLCKKTRQIALLFFLFCDHHPLLPLGQCLNLWGLVIMNFHGQCPWKSLN